MVNFLTQDEAITTLETVQNKILLTTDDTVKLASIKVCIAGDLMGVNLWGQNIDDARPLFCQCDKPTDTNNDFLIENYNYFMERYNNAYNLFKR